MKPTSSGIPEAKTTRAALKLVGRRRICLSGTPVQNCAEDLWPIFHFLMPGFLGRRKTLKETLQQENEAIERLRQRVAPFVLRRLKKEVATELPPKTEILLHAQMSDEQERFYRELLEKERVGVMDLLGSKGLERSRVSILAAITRLASGGMPSSPGWWRQAVVGQDRAVPRPGR